MKEIDDMEDKGIEGRTILKVDVEEMGWEGTDWINLAQAREKWQALVNMVMKLQAPQNAGNFLTC
jgi:hypothetical protein